MTEASARVAANLALAAAGAAVAYVVVTTPPLRRLAKAAVRFWLGASVPVYLATELGRAWAEPRSGPPGSWHRRGAADA
jgi:hypothetical protein